MCDETGKPAHLSLTAGHISDYTGAGCFLPSLFHANQLIVDCGYDADWFIAALKNQGVTPCISPCKNRIKRRRYSKQLYKQRHKIEIMFGRIKDWRRIALRCAYTFFSAICLAATVIFYLKECVLSLVNKTSLAGTFSMPSKAFPGMNIPAYLVHILNS